MNEKYNSIEDMVDISGITKIMEEELDNQMEQYGCLSFHPPEAPVVLPTEEQEQDMASAAVTQMLRTEFADEREQIKKILIEHVNGFKNSDSEVQVSEDFKLTFDEEDESLIDDLLMEQLESALFEGVADVQDEDEGSELVAEEGDPLPEESDRDIN